MLGASCQGDTTASRTIALRACAYTMDTAARQSYNNIRQTRCQTQDSAPDDDFKIWDRRFG